MCTKVRISSYQEVINEVLPLKQNLQCETAMALKKNTAFISCSRTFSFSLWDHGGTLCVALCTSTATEVTSSTSVACLFFSILLLPFKIFGALENLCIERVLCERKSYYLEISFFNFFSSNFFIRALFLTFYPTSLYLVGNELNRNFTFNISLVLLLERILIPILSFSLYARK